MNPNIILIVCDEERYKYPVKFDSRRILGKTGTTFTNMYINASPCSPSRSTIFTGQYSTTTNMVDNSNMPYINDMSPKIQTIGHMLTKNGYYCAYKGKWHLSDIPEENSMDSLKKYGFAEFQEGGDTTMKHGWKHDPIVARDSINFIKKHFKDTTPWFLTVSLDNPHDIMGQDVHDITRVENIPTFSKSIKPIPKTSRYRYDNNVKMPKSFYNRKLYSKPSSQTTYEGMINLIFGRINLHDIVKWEKHLNYYINATYDADRHIINIINTVKKLKLKNTIIIFTTDHGDMAGSHGLRQKGPLIYEETNHIPLIVCDFKKEKRISNKQVSCIDIVPTILDIAGIKQNNNLHGNSIFSNIKKPILFQYYSIMTLDVNIIQLMINPNKDSLNAVTKSSMFKKGFIVSIIDLPYKFARYFAPNLPKDKFFPESLEDLILNFELELYNLDTDPNEIENLAFPPFDVKLVLKMNNKLNNLLKNHSISSPKEKKSLNKMTSPLSFKLFINK
jgi:arylsulfatase A-like enzyme